MLSVRRRACAVSLSPQSKYKEFVVKGFAAAKEKVYGRESRVHGWWDAPGLGLAGASRRDLLPTSSCACVKRQEHLHNIAEA